MRSTFLKSLVLGAVGSMMMVGSAMAVSLPIEYGTINPTDTTGTLSDFAGTEGPAYFIWTDDVYRTSWNIAWIGSGSAIADIWQFQGFIKLENALGTFTTFSFETTGDWIDTADLFDNGANFDAWSNSGYDGISFTIGDSTPPSYVGFDLFYREASSTSSFNAMDSSLIFIGGGLETVASLGEDQDFAIAAPAPVPEPATMLLFGSGLLGLAAISRRRKGKK